MHLSPLFLGGANREVKNASGRGVRMPDTASSFAPSGAEISVWTFDPTADAVGYDLSSLSDFQPTSVNLQTRSHG